MADSNKRKMDRGDGRDGRGGGPKRSKGGSAGRWQTPHQKTKEGLPPRGGRIDPGDVGIWASCVKNKEGKATEELKVLFDEFAESMYGVNANGVKDDEDTSVDDIESSIQKELASMEHQKGPAKLFTPVFLDLHCVLFFKTTSPIVPVEFVHRICEEAAQNPDGRKHRFVNRLTPMTMSGKATEKGLEEIGAEVLKGHFQLAADELDGEKEKSEQTGCSYAIRTTFRNHKTLQRDEVIKLVASLVGSKHRVDLTNPDKVILVEVFQTICGMSVVESDWESLKRFNLNEIYQPTPKPGASSGNGNGNGKDGAGPGAEATPEVGRTDEAAAKEEEVVREDASTIATVA